VHHRTIQINHQPDAAIFQFNILTTFVYSSPCFGRYSFGEDKFMRILTRAVQFKTKAYINFLKLLFILSPSFVFRISWFIASTVTTNFDCVGWKKRYFSLQILKSLWVSFWGHYCPQNKDMENLNKEFLELWMSYKNDITVSRILWPQTRNMSLSV
jgi:hypothetical protein